MEKSNERIFEELIFKEEIDHSESEEGIKIEENELLLFIDYHQKIKQEQEEINDIAENYMSPDLDSRNFVSTYVRSNVEETSIIEFTNDISDTDSESSSPISGDDENSDKIYSCKHCHFRSKYRGNLKQHENAKHFGKIEPCLICGKKYKDPSNLNRHVREAHKGKLRKSLNQIHNCIYCAFSTNRKENLRMHMNSLHTLNKIYPCDICSYVGTRVDSLRNHKQNMHENKEKYYKCSRCSFKTLRRDFFDNHFEDSHMELELFACSFCEYKATFSCNLARHIQRKHS